MNNSTSTSVKSAPVIERIALARAKDKISSARWTGGGAVFPYAVLASIIILKFENISTQIVAVVAIVGLALVWVIGWRRGRAMLPRFYEEELLQLQEFYTRGRTEAQTPSILTRRETEILENTACGFMNKQIAAKLGLSEQTVKNHLSSILRKMDVNDRTQAVVLAIHNGWISASVVNEANPKNHKEM